MKSKQELLIDFLQMVGGYGNCFFKLKDGQVCHGEIEQISDNILQFCPEFQVYPEWNSVWENCSYEKIDDIDEFILIPVEDIDLSSLLCWNDQSGCFMNPQWDVDRECWIQNEATPGAIPMPAWLKEDNPEGDKRLKAIGYWQSDYEEPYLPHPRYLVESGWRENERDQIIAYLKAGQICSNCFGWSFCRFNCSDAHNYRVMGSHDFTDGEWIWTEGLAHYVEQHNVCLPDAFILTMKNNAWSVPQNLNFSHRSEIGVSYFYWLQWATEYIDKKQK